MGLSGLIMRIWEAFVSGDPGFKVVSAGSRLG